MSPMNFPLQGLSREIMSCSEAQPWSPGRGGPGEASGDSLDPSTAPRQGLCHAPGALKCAQARMPCWWEEAVSGSG